MSAHRVGRKQAKIRQNLSLSPDTLEMLRRQAEAEDTSMSALVTRYIRDKEKGAAHLRVADAPGNSSHSTHAGGAQRVKYSQGRIRNA